jgi:hypothetical protein
MENAKSEIFVEVGAETSDRQDKVPEKPSGLNVL